MQQQACDFLIVGAGIAGASAAYFLSEAGSVVLLEQESQPGYHTTGRSAALFTEAYGNGAIRALTTASRRFLAEPPPGFAEHPILSPRGMLLIGRDDQAESLDAAFDTARTFVPAAARLDAAAALRRMPVLRPEAFVGAVWEPEAMDIDVHALHQGFLRGARGRGAALVADAPVQGLDCVAGAWHADTPRGRFSAPVLINAAGAWCDTVAGQAGVRPIGLVPKRRTALLLPAPEGHDSARWPMCCDVDEQFYFKPDAGQLLLSPADETPSAPCDAQPEELDVALAAARLEAATSLQVRRIAHRWAGLRSFVADKTPVAGFDPQAPGFFWLAGQGGYGIQTAPAMGRLAAALALGRPLPAELRERGLTAEALSPARLARPV